MLFILFSVSVVAFEGKEHSQIGNAGFLLALDALGELEGIKDPCIRLMRTINTASNFLSTNPGSPSYGELVCSVDYVMSPFEFLLEHGVGLSQTVRSWNDINPDFLKGNQGIVFQKLRASHNNTAHFQDELLYMLHFYHKIAVQKAQEGELFLALLFSSFSSHYLHDFFAPGHMITPRRNLPDSVSLSWHELHNEKGADFVVSPKGLRLLPPFLKIVEKDPAKYLLGDADFKCLHSKVYLRGDGFLDKQPDQKLLMTLAQARMVLDVLESFLSETCINHFSTYEWMAPIHQRSKNLKVNKPLMAGIELGYYEIDKIHRSFHFTPAISIGMDSLHAKNDDIRYKFMIEHLVAGTPGAPNFLRDQRYEPRSKFNLGLTLNYTYVTDDHYDAKGPGSRIILAFPEIDMMFSATYSRLEFSTIIGEFNREMYSLRAEIGFSFMTGYVGFGTGNGINFEGVPFNSNLIESGFTFQVPISKIFSVKGTLK